MIEMEDIHKCSICVEEFRNPKIIPCFHTFCRDCLSAYVERVLKKGKFNCPICRTVIENPKNGVDGFQTNFYIEEIKKDVETLSKNGVSPHPLSEIKKGVCGKHEAEELSIYCEDCKIPCCRDCKIEAHDGHRSMKLEHKATKLYKNAEELILAIKTKIESIQKYERELKEELKAVENEKGTVEGEIMKSKAMVEVQLANIVDAKVAELRHLTKTICNCLAKTLKKVTRVSDELQNANSMLEQTIESQDPLKLLQVISNVREKLNLMEMNNISLPVNAEQFFPGLIFQKSDVAIGTAIEPAIGKVFMKKHPYNFQSQLQIMSEFRVDIKNNMKYYVKVILPVSQNEIWLAIRCIRKSDNSTFMKKLNENGNNILSFSLQGLVNSMSNFVDGTVAVTMPLENKICVIEGNGNVYELASVKHPIRIVCGKDELFVCSVESSGIKDHKLYNVKRVLVLSKEGSVKRSIEFFDGRCLFTFPGKISLSYRGEIVVCDFAENKIICIDLDGRPKHTYQDENDVCFGGVFYDDAGYVLVDTSKGIHVLDDELKLVQKYDMDFNANHMVSMAVGQNGHIYTVNDVFRVSVWKYIKQGSE